MDEHSWDYGDGRLVLPFVGAVVEIDLSDAVDDPVVNRWRVYYWFESKTNQTGCAHDLSIRGYVLQESFHFQTKSKIDEIPSVAWR